jgi:hypothetical protein
MRRRRIPRPGIRRIHNDEITHYLDWSSIMKKWLFGVLCLALTNTAWAQAPVAQPTSGPVLLPTMPMAANYPVQQASHACAPACASAPCCTPTKTICVPEPSTKIKVTIEYCSICEKICFPKCSLFGGCQNGCQTGCQPGYDCGHPYTKRVLVKKYVEEELPRNKCVAVTVPACEANRCATSAVYGSPEPIVAPPTKK